ncbi:MAG TPA: hypothetical protein VMM18_10820 [Gemmatimonadaceae bacterium]|nr:hypothetical protein [Gemmatimonadaceae bacterium]
MIHRVHAMALTPVLALFAAGACSTDDRAADEWMPLQLASTEFHADTTGGELVAQVVVVYENPIDDPVHLMTCGPGTPWPGRIASSTTPTGSGGT